jgi:hypothetical protein
LVGNDPQFLSEVTRVATKFNIKEGDLLGLMASESGLDPAADNGSHVGLIQFSADSARTVGTTQAALKSMTRAQQMKYVEKYFDYWKLPKGASAGQIYSVVFAPAYASKDDSTTMYTKADGAAYTGNIGLDANKDGTITVGELGQRIENKKQSFGITDTGVAMPAAPQAPAPATPPPVAAPNPIVIMPIVGAAGTPPQPVAPPPIPMTETGQVDWMKLAQQQRLAGS